MFLEAIFGRLKSLRVRKAGGEGSISGGFYRQRRGNVTVTLRQLEPRVGVFGDSIESYSEPNCKFN